MWDTDLILCATERIPEVLARAGIEETDIEIAVPSILGSAIAGQAVYWNSLRGREAPLQPIVHADFVTLASGSGLVHMAPGHGFDDYNVCLKHDIPVFAPVDDHGCFTGAALPDAPKILKGKDIFTDGSKAVIDILKSGSREGGKDLVWATHRIKHKYPIDWRTKKPLIIRATAQWFAGVDTIKDQALASLKDVAFLPETGRSRLESFVSGRSQWCISRQRAWGVPIPALYHVDGRGKLGEAVMTAESVEHIIEVIKQRGVDAWWTDAEDEQAWIPLSLGPGTYKRGKDTMDVWFDSGTSWTQLPQDRSPPADVYIEGTDQHRGWFQSSLLTYVAQQASASSMSSISTEPIPSSTTTSPSPKAPYKTLITHGFILDHLGRKMSKSIGNVIAPSQITDGTLLPPMKKRKGQSATDPATYDAMGPDALRLWVASSDYTRDVMIGQPVLKSVNGLLHKLRVTFRWLLGALEDFDPASDALWIVSEDGDRKDWAARRPLSFATRAATHHLHTTLDQANAAFQAYEPYRAILSITRYVNVYLSAFYFEYSKDLLYAGTLQERRQVQGMCFEVLKGLLTMLAPVTPILVREVVDHCPSKVKEYFITETTDPFKQIWSTRAKHYTFNPIETDNMDFPLDFTKDSNVDQAIAWLAAASSAVKAAQEAARADKRIGSGLECRVELILPSPAAPGPHTEEASKNSVAFFFALEKRGELEALLVASEVCVSSWKEHGGLPDGDVSDEAQEDAASKPGDEAWMYQRSFDLPGIEDRSCVARVLPPSKAKCPRCWRYVSPIPASPEADVGLCGRCETVMAERAEQRV